MTVAHTLATASKAVYLEPNEAEDWATDRGFDNFTWFDTLGTQAMVVTTDDQCVLAFRGTEPTNITDWMTDFDIRQVPGPYGEVHAGFYEALSHVWSDIEPLVLEGDRFVYVTGHSLGGALATLATAQLGFGQLYTFGSPKVFDAKGAKTFDKYHESYRFVNNNDIVARVPLTRYEHIGHLCYFTSRGKMWVDPSWQWVAVDHAWGRVWKRFDGIRDHNIDKYISLTSK